MTVIILRANEFSGVLDPRASFGEKEDGEDVHGDIRAERARSSFGIYNGRYNSVSGSLFVIHATVGERISWPTPHVVTFTLSANFERHRTFNLEFQFPERRIILVSCVDTCSTFYKSISWR